MAAQAIIGPVVTVAVRAVDQLAVSWSVDPVAVKYYVYRSTSGAAFAFVASILNSNGAPPTSYIDTGLTASVSYCYAIVSQYPDGTMSTFGPSACGSTGGSMGSISHVSVAGSLFQLIGNVSATEQLWVAQVNALAIEQTVTAGSIAVQCAGAGGGYFIPCARSREVGGWQCGLAVACGTAATSSVPFPTAFIVGAQNHLDIGVVASAPTFIATTAVLTVQ